MMNENYFPGQKGAINLQDYEMRWALDCPFCFGKGVPPINFTEFMETECL